MLFQYSNQQWLNVELVELIDDYGWDIGVTMRSGRIVRVHGSDREAFFAAIASRCDPKPTTGK